MKFLPIFLDVKDKPCLVVGGGGIATRKVFLLLRAGARVSVVSPELNHELEEKKQAFSAASDHFPVTLDLA